MERNQIETLELKSIQVEMKNSLEGFRQKKESVKSKTGQRKLSSLRNRKEKHEEKWTEPKGLVGYHQHMHYGLPGGQDKQRERERAAEIIPEGLIAQNFPHWMKDRNLHIQEAQWHPRRINSKDIHSMWENGRAGGPWVLPVPTFTTRF